MRVGDAGRGPALTTVGQLMRQAERSYPDRIGAEDDSGRSATVRQLAQRSNRLANGLLENGVRPGDAVGFAGRNCIEFIEIDLALGTTGLAKIPLYFRLSAAEIATCLEISGARAVIADEDTAAALEAVDDRLQGLLRIVIGNRPGWHSYEDFLAAGSSSAPVSVAAPDDIYNIRFTSGSTGPPKGVPISQSASRAAILGNGYVFAQQGWCPQPRTLHMAPMVFASGWSVLPTLLAGGTNVIHRDFDPDVMLRQLAGAGITWMFTVPTMLRRLAEVSSLEALRGSSLECLMYAGEPAPLEALAVLTEHTDALVQCFGQTEAPASTTVLGRAEHADAGLWSSCGRPIPGVEFSVLVKGEVLDTHLPGQRGELVMRTPSLATTLLGAEEEYAERLLPGSWWRTGDVGYLDEDYRVCIVGRANDTIISGGSNIHPTEIERALEQHEHVLEAAVVGVPHPKWGESPAALLYAPALSEADVAGLDEWLRGQIAPFKRPRFIVLSADRLPRRGAEGKVSRPQAREHILRALAERAERPIPQKGDPHG